MLHWYVLVMSYFNVLRTSVEDVFRTSVGTSLGVNRGQYGDAHWMSFGDVLRTSLLPNFAERVVLFIVAIICYRYGKHKSKQKILVH